ncbi:MAG TPA: hypothetical protein VLU43_11715 [Anaeromyxobacteraceae bacterium]|nr:hypothetical protein [Anaeromyxobacteraceae bacterium]
MRAYVLPDARLARLAGRFVWLDIDTEKPANAPFLRAFPIDSYPTLLVVDPRREAAVLRWTGTATAEQIERLALDGEREMRAASSPGLGGAARGPDAALARGDRLAAERRPADAAAAYREALAGAGASWRERDRTAESLVQVLAGAGDDAACAAAAGKVLPQVLAAGRRARLAAQGLACALGIGDAAARDAALRVLEPPARAAAGAREVLADDRSWLWSELSEAREALGDARGALADARRWLAFLDGEAARARTPAARAALDGQRLDAAIRAGTPDRMLAPLLLSERELPGDFVPAQNLARLYLELGRPAEALAAARRALENAEGPRRVRIRVLEADALDALGRRAEARAALEDAVRFAGELPEGVRPARWSSEARARLERAPGG